MGKTIAEKILSQKSGQDARANDIVVAELDFVMGQDGTSGLAIRAFEEMNSTRVFDPAKIAMVIDHSAPSPLEGVSALHQQMRVFADQQKIIFTILAMVSAISWCLNRDMLCPEIWSSGLIRIPVRMVLSMFFPPGWDRLIWPPV